MPGAVSGAVTAALALALMVMPAIVLLVACLNLVDLLLARGQVRRQEMAIRSSLGGRRGRLTRQLIAEGLLLAFAGGAVGLLLSMWATNALLTSLRPVIPVGLSLPELDVDWRVLVGTVGFSLAATLIFGAWPAWALTGRAVATDLTRHVRDAGGRRSGGRIGNALVIGQVALSVLLLASGGLFLMSALSAATADPGFRLDGGLLVEVDPGLAGYDEARGRQSHLRSWTGCERSRAGSRDHRITVSFYGNRGQS
jgi:predicted lysophospholipase L1 biosynthesis ABC-type transport system permease subunit